MVLRLIVLLFFAAQVSGFIFTSPPSLAALGHVYTPMLKMLYQYVNITAYNRNYSLQIPPDNGACTPFTDPPGLYQGKVVWFNERPCPTYLGHAHLQQAQDLQSLGAVAQISMSFGFTATWTCGRNVGGTARVGMGPWVFMTNLKDWNYAPDPATNPQIPFKSFTKTWATNNITGFLEFPDKNDLIEEMGWLPLGVTGQASFISWTCYTMTMVALIVNVVKLTQFIQFQGGVRLSLPQMVLFLAACACWWLFFYLQWANPMYSYTPDYVTAFFQTHYAPYWYSAVTLYAFYLIEVSHLAASGGALMPTLNYFKIPAAVMCIVLLILELIAACSFIVFDAAIQYPQLNQMIGCIYLIVPGLVAILVAFATVSLLINIGSLTNPLAIKTGVVGLLLFLFVCLSMTFASILLAGANTWKSPMLGQYGSMWFATWLTCLTLGASFRVQLQKEIEVSKSATSSTSSSSGSSRSGNSGSSSSNADPVIEL